MANAVFPARQAPRYSATEPPHGCDMLAQTLMLFARGRATGFMSDG